MSDQDQKKPASKPRRKLVISEEALRKMVLEDEELAQVVGGGWHIPQTPHSPTHPPPKVVF